MDLILFGIQGSGKGTQAKRLAAEKGFTIFEAGGELRKIAASGSALGNEVKSFIDIGKLVPHEIIMNVLREAIEKHPKDEHLLFDGVPRDENQMRDFDVVMKKLGRDFRCIHIRLDPEEGVRRILKRAEIEGRADDASEETIRKRMNLFTEKTLPVIKGYTAQGKVTDIDGMGNTEEIYQRMVDVLS